MLYVIKKNKSLVEEVKALPGTVSEENTPRKGVEEELMTFKSLVTAADELAASLTESNEGLEATHAKVALAKAPAVRADAEKAGSEIYCC